MTTPRPAKETMTIDIPAAMRRIYELDPEWSWKNGVQVFVKYEDLSASKLLTLHNAAQGLAAFANYFERDIPLSGLIELFNEMNRHQASVDTES